MTEVQLARPNLADVAKQKFDVVVVGGGINGAGIAREAQLAGYRTLLVEREDFGAGTTSRATRLIHGGLRYLEHGEFGLVYESLHERETLVREAPHLVRPLRLLVPVYAGDARPGWKVRAGLVLYDLFSLRKSLPWHRAMPERALAEYEPGLNRDGLRAVYLMSDAQVEFPERLVAEAVREFVEAGGVALNHASVAGMVSPGHKLRAILVRDELDARDGAAGGITASPQPGAAVIHEIETKVVVNAAGPWVDEVLAGTDAERHDRLLGGTKGSHLVAEWPGAPTHAIFASAKADGRPFFILPWYRYTLVGTTDIRYDGDPSEARCTPEELAYLLDEATRLFPSTPLRREHVLYTYSGVRPLPYTPNGEDESTISRSHFVIDHAKRGGPDGLLSIVGGKLTTYRSLARVAIPAIRKHCAPSETAARDEGQGTRDKGRGSSDGAPADDPLAVYGGRRAEVEALIAGDAALGERICEHNPEVLGQVAYAVEREGAVTLGDVLLRRLPVGWSACHALDGAERAALVMGAGLGWDEGRVVSETAAYEAEMRRVCVKP
ncbi:MAG: glycerol-3-phosphate dehydrogenase/oxidase [Chloroflexi bacterium]|nr:glycerol-3-phosphate dehydrogenase/oxidase [Chloroflexota bacterium]